MPGKLAKIVALIKALTEQLFTGQLVIHFNRGCPCKVEKHEHMTV